MKSKILLLGAVIAAFTYTSFAADALLSPRAQGNQIKVVNSSSKTSSITVAAIVPGAGLLSPRAAGNQTVAVTGMEVVAAKCPALGSPKYVAAVGSVARTSCCGLTLAECGTMDRMPK